MGGKGPPPSLQITGAELTELVSVVEFATLFRSPIAPVRTNNTKATTESHFDIGTSEWGN